MAVTPMKKLTKIAQGVEVELPGFLSGETFTVRLRRPSLLALAKEGRIPNGLLSCVEELFNTGSVARADLASLYGVLELFAKATLVEPSYEELEEAGIQLTDAQLLFLYNFAQAGVTDLHRFRPGERLVESSGDGTALPQAAQ